MLHGYGENRGRWVIRRPDFRAALASVLLLYALPAHAQTAQNANAENLDREFQAASAEFDAGHYSDAATRLEKLLPHVPKSFEVHELLGMAYSAESKNDKAVEQFEEAARLNPASAAGHTNLAAALAQAGKVDQATQQFHKAIALEPRNYDANHDLGELYVQEGKLAEAIPFLEAAQRIQTGSYGNGYDLAMAEFLTGKLAEARELVQSMLQQKETGELHNLLGQVEEKDKHFLEAVNEFEKAAHIDPSEDNLFDWGSELLLHRTYEPAIDVFQSAVQRYPASPRLMIGLGMALDLRGRYDDAVKALLKAADLDPSDARCYVFLSKAYDSSPSQAEDVIQRFKRYAELEPGNGLAQYYYAMSLWKGKRVEDSNLDLKVVQALLEKAIALDEKLPEAHVQLGNLYADRKQYEKSIPEYTRALELNPNLPDAHYRLGQGYVHLGQKDKAQEEFAVYQKQRAEHMAEVDKERAEVQQFMYSEKTGSANKP
jgi:tetratricopeptide (TPR) repeat protein